MEYTEQELIELKSKIKYYCSIVGINVGSYFRANKNETKSYQLAKLFRLSGCLKGEHSGNELIKAMEKVTNELL
jgi:hypothetical protein